MKLFTLLTLLFVTTTVHAKESSLLLQGVVPLTAEVVIKGHNQVISKSSAGLKTQIKKRDIASIVEVTAP
jgi:hypothetical protein